MPSPEEHLQPVIGYIIARLNDGDTFDAIMAGVERKTDWGRISESDIHSAWNLAHDDWETANYLRQSGHQGALSGAVSGLSQVAPDDIIGLRVYYQLILPNGTVHDGSVTVNAAQHVELQEILDYVRTVWVPQIGQDSLSALGVTTVGDVNVQSVFIGGLQGAGITIE